MSLAADDGTEDPAAPAVSAAACDDEGKSESAPNGVVAQGPAADDDAMKDDVRFAFAADCAARWPALLGEAEVPGAEAADRAEMPDSDLHTIRVDIPRTRAAEPLFKTQAMQARLEFLLTAFCKSEGVRYMQGLHEVAAVFAYLQESAVAGGWDDSKTLDCFIRFVRKFVPCFYDGAGFVILHVSLLFFRQLLLYHHPDLHNQLEDAGVSPLIYATPWFITFFAARTPLAVLLRLWDRSVIRDEPAFMPFLAVAMMAEEKASILAADEEDMNLAVDRAGMSDLQKLESIWASAEALHGQTPRSFIVRMNKVLKHMTETCRQPTVVQGSWTDKVLSRVEQERRLVVLPTEIAAHFARLQPAAAASAAPAPGLPQLRLLVLDVRPKDEFRIEHAPHALHFHPSCLRRFVSTSGADNANSRAERIAAALSAAASSIGGFVHSAASGSAAEEQSAQSEASSTPAVVSRSSSSALSTPAPAENKLLAEVFAALQSCAAEEWGEDWLSESAKSHLVLLGGEEDWDNAEKYCKANGSGPMVLLFEALTEQLSLARVSVVLGGFAALHKEMLKRGLPMSTQSAEERPESAFLESARSGLKAAETNIVESARSSLKAASEALPAAEKVRGRLGGFFKSSAGAARALAGGAAKGIAETAAAARQQAKEGVSAVKEEVALLRQQAAEARGKPPKAGQQADASKPADSPDDDDCSLENDAEGVSQRSSSGVLDVGSDASTSSFRPPERLPASQDKAIGSEPRQEDESADASERS
eukprot:TRINITY_DN52793_c0_g1_i1.p1 TRINITY_DN52793_c0_g1~~TRINITY_DN52793_c0_g1_i1.p1  ORF type:complete len:762 (-),score=179.69 TRINITY_DN52793_c0_g1_i1:28-2313(-)